MKATPTEILQIFKDEDLSIDSGQLDSGSSLREAGLDSLDLSLLFFAIQEKYEVKISDEEIARLDSIKAIVEWLNKKIG